MREVVRPVTRHAGVPAEAAASTVALRGLTKRYGGQAAVDGIDLDIAAGSLLSLLGPSGCGKTTTLRMIAGLIAPTAGTIAVGGTDITVMPASRRNIGVLFQNYALFPHLSVGQNVGFGLRMRRVGRDAIRSAVEEALALVHLEGFLDRMPDQLSGGQQQRVALARALAIRPSVLLLDEPMSALDRSLREAVRTELRQLQQRLGITTVLVTHDQEEALTISDAVAVMNRGRIEQVGRPSEIYANPATRFVASFVGTTNFQQAEILTARPDAVELAVYGRKLPLAPGTPVGSEGRVTVMVRPEHVQFRSSTGGATGPEEVPARLLETSYRGADTIFTFGTEDGARILATRTNDGPGGAIEMIGGSFALSFGRNLCVLRDD